MVGMNYDLTPFKKVLVANRGEIAIRILRAAAELDLTTVGIYTHEDRYSLHRYKADETYQVGSDDEALKPYLDIDQIIHLAKRKEVDAIHPGYGFLSENVEFVRRCEQAGICFVGPTSDAMSALGNKTDAKTIARKAGVPVIEDSEVSLTDNQIAATEAKRIGYPVIIKAVHGGGGRGMRVAHSEEELLQLLDEARNEATRAFGDGTVFLERYIEDPKHIEVQILADEQGNTVHLYERDCSIQRRFQKVVEVAPAPSLRQETRKKLYDYALAIAKQVDYTNAGTVEFLVDKSGSIFFIEVNPRIQVEHTVSEEVTGIDIVRAQLLIAQGYPLSCDRIGVFGQNDVHCNGFAVQCRVTTEDPRNDFMPDYGRLVAYRSPGGFGIRLDAGSAYSGAQISPFFDSMLVKLTASGRSLRGACARLERALREFRIRGVSTNVEFLRNIILDPVFQEGRAGVRYLDSTPHLFEFKDGQNRATRLLEFLADVTVNGNPDVRTGLSQPSKFTPPVVPNYDAYSDRPEGSRDRLKQMGRSDFIQWLRDEPLVQFTDTTLRDAHQSLIATRVRTKDLLAAAESYSYLCPQLFSMEVWGGATFDVALRFLKECPWERLRLLRAAAPNILFQMLLRGSNAVGYTAYPDNLIEKFIEHAAEEGIDVFRIFDSMNWLEAMKVSIKTVCERTDSLAEACICYTGDILDPERSKFTLQYYVDLAKQLEDQGAHLLAIKDMAGLLKPLAATELIGALKDAVQIPIHLHTHDTASVQAATYLHAVDAGVDVLDVAVASMSGLTSQPNFNSLVSVSRGHDRMDQWDTGVLNDFSTYWAAVRERYYPFESGLKAGTAEVYHHEIPGGQYSNLGPQARALGLGDRFTEITSNYAIVNELLGDIIKVTPSSKVVGDVALFMTSNGLSAEDIIDPEQELSFPESLKSFFRGELGQPHGGFPEQLQKRVLKDEQPYTDRPNKHLAPVDIETELAEFQERFGSHLSVLDFLSYKLYPKVFEEFTEFRRRFGNVTPVPSEQFFFGLKPEEEVEIEIAEGKVILVRLVYITEPNEDGERIVSFKLNGQTRAIEVRDNSVESSRVVNPKVSGPNHVGAPLQGKLSKILVSQGDAVEKGTPLFVLEAMKMESTVASPIASTISGIRLNEGAMVEQDDLVIELA